MTQVNFIGSATLNAIQNQNQRQTLAQRALKIFQDNYASIIGDTKKFVTDRIIEKAVDRNLVFDMSKYVGKEFSCVCTDGMFTEIKEWLVNEGFIVEVEADRTPIAQARYGNTYNDDNYNKKSLKTFYISW